MKAHLATLFSLNSAFSATRISVFANPAAATAELFMSDKHVEKFNCNVVTFISGGSWKTLETFLRNSSAESLRRFRSLSPAFTPIDETAPAQNQTSWCCLRRRSQSFPSQDLRRSKSSYFPKIKRPTSAERSVSTEGKLDEEDGEEYQRKDDDVRHNPGSLPRTPRKRGNSPAKLRPRRPKSLAEQSSPPKKSPSEMPRPKSASKVNQDAETKLRQYFLENSSPNEKKNNVYEVFDYYSEQYKSKDMKILPHLQPNNLKPYGTGENLIFPSNTGNRNRTIKYPILEPGYTEQVVRSYQKKGRGSDMAGPSSSRDYSTASPSDEQLEKCKQILAEYKKANPDYTSSNKSPSLVPGSVEEKSFLQKTIKLISEFKGQQAKQNMLVDDPKSSSGLTKCDQIISDYKKLNPDYKSSKRDFRSGSSEEKEAVNNALNFAANYRKYFSQNNNFIKENQDSTLCLRNKAVSEMQVRKQHRESVGLPEEQAQQVETNEAAPKATLVSLLSQSSSQSSIKRKKYSFGDNMLHLPEVPVTPTRVRVGPKANLLQSSAPPEVTKRWDKIQLGKNERLVSPWPSYADHLKNQSSPPHRRHKEIVYPPMPDDLKTMKNGANLEIKSRNVPQKVDFSTSSLHNNAKLAKLEEASPNNQETSQRKIFLQRGSVENPQNSLPDLRWIPNFNVRHFSTSSKGTVCNEETVTPKRSKPKADDNPICDSTGFESPPEPSDYFSSHDCGCVSPKPPLDVPPLKRLKRRSEPKEPPKVCPPAENCPPRADTGLKIKPRKLPKIVPPKDCPCAEIEMQEGCPLPRLKKKPVEEPEKVCPCVGIECDCPPRADASLKVEKKCLPKLPLAENCPCVAREIEDVPLLKPLKKVKIPEPKRPCLQKCDCCTPRADEGLKVKKKSLPKLKAASCPCVEEKPPEDVPPLPRLKEVEVCEPKRTCDKRDPCDESLTERADDICGYKVKSKTLSPMLLKAENNHVSVRRYAKNSKKPGSPSVNVSHKRKFSMYSNMNKTWKFRRILSTFKFYLESANYSNKSRRNERNLDCCCVELEYPKGDVTPKLKPLAKFKTEDVGWSKRCQKVTANARADENWKNKKKSLSKLVPSKCPCIEKEQPSGDQPRLKRLPKLKKTGIDCAKMRQCFKPDLNSRADDNKEIKRKTLPKLRISDCPCADQYATLVDVAPLKRLPKVETPGVDWKSCEKGGKAPRADEKPKERAKNLPQLKPSKCPCIEMKPPDEADQPKLKRLPKYKKTDANWKVVAAGQNLCKSRLPPRADEKLEIRKKSLPKLRKGDWPCIEPNASLVDVALLRRLPNCKKSDVNWKEIYKYSKRPCGNALRADECLKVESKSLPQLKAGKCPCMETEFPADNQPNIKHLPNYEKEDVVWKPKWENPCKKVSRADDNYKKKKNSLPKIRTSDCHSVDPQANLQDVASLKRLSKFKKDDIDWGHFKTYMGKCKTTKTDDNLKSERKSLPQLKSNYCPCVENPTPQRDFPKPKHLEKMNDEEGIIRVPKCVPKCSERADELLGYEVKQRKLPSLLPVANKNCYRTVRRCSYPTFSTYRNIIYTHHRMLNTTSTLFKKAKCERPKNPTCKTQELKKVDTKKRECKKLEGKPGKKTCPKIKGLPGCKPRVRNTCEEDYVFKECTKQKSPYPSFSECGDIADFPTCECPVPDLKFLQPKYPIIKGPDIQAPPPPEHAYIDPLREKECVMKKLGMENEGETKTCDDFQEHERPKEFKGKELLAQAEREAEQKAKEEGTSLEEMREKASEEACCQDKSKAGSKSKKECPVVYTDTCCVGEPKLQGPEKKKKSSSMLCGQEKSEKESDATECKSTCKSEPKSAAKSKSKSSTKSKPKSAIKSKSKYASKGESRSASKFASKSASKTCTSSVVQKDQPMSLWEKIMSFFKPKNPPPAVALDPCLSSTKKPEKSKSKECPSVPKAVCGDKKSKEKSKKESKQATKKGVSKAKKKSKPTKQKKAKLEAKESKKEKKPKTSLFGKSIAKSDKKEKKVAKTSKSKESTASKSSKKSNKPAKRSKSAEKKKSAKKSKPAEKLKADKKEKSAKTCKSAEVYKGKEVKPKVECTPKKKDPCAKKSKPKKEDPCKPKQDDGCAEEDNSRFSKMFPPEMPDCRPRRRIRRSPPPDACLPPSIPMEECRRSLKECVVEEVECGPPKKNDKDESKDACRPVDCKPEKGKKNSSGGKKSGKCKEIKLDNCPPRVRDVCKEGYVFKPCKAQESPYPSFSECRPPFPKIKRNECVVARERARATLSKIKMNVNKKTQEDKCQDKEKEKGRRCYSTMSAVARALAFNPPSQWKRHYGSKASGRGPKYPPQLLKTEEKTAQDKEGSNDALSQRLLASIEEGIEKLESQDADSSYGPYCQILQSLQKLSEEEINDFFDQEPLFNPLKSDVRETVSFVCKLNPRADQMSALNSEISFQPRCVGISDPIARSEEMKIIEAFRNLCNRLCVDTDSSETPYEELERIKTEDMKRELDDLLRRTGKGQ